jgi:hypothetical protein
VILGNIEEVCHWSLKNTGTTTTPFTFPWSGNIVRIADRIRGRSNPSCHASIDQAGSKRPDHASWNAMRSLPFHWQRPCRQLLHPHHEKCNCQLPQFQLSTFNDDQHCSSNEQQKE